MGLVANFHFAFQTGIFWRMRRLGFHSTGLGFHGTGGSCNPSAGGRCSALRARAGGSCSALRFQTEHFHPVFPLYPLALVRAPLLYLPDVLTFEGILDQMAACDEIRKPIMHHIYDIFWVP